MAELDTFAGLAAQDSLCVVTTNRADGTSQASVVNAGVVDHPVTGAPVAAFVGRPSTRKIHHLRDNPVATLVWRAGWAWVACEGTAELIGPDDLHDGVTPADVPGLLRTVYSASGGGQHDDWAEYDRVVASERRMAVLITPKRIYLNP